MLALLLAAFVITLIIFKYYFENRKFYQLAAKIPHAKWDRWIDSCLPLIGYAHRFLGNTGDAYGTLNVFARKTITNGGLMKMWVGPHLYAMISDPGAAEIILTTCLQRDRFYRFGASWSERGLLLADVNLWKRKRKVYNPSFSTRVTDGYLDVMNDQFSILMKRLKPLAGKGTVNVEDYLNKAALSVICKTTFNLEGYNLQTDEHSTVLEALQDQTNVIFTRLFRVWLYPELIFQLSNFGKRERKNLKILHSFSYEMIKAKREELTNPKQTKESDNGFCLPVAISKSQTPILELMLKMCDEEKTITESHIREDIDILLEAGYASSAIAAGLLMTLLGTHPKIQEKLYDELNHYYGDSIRDVEKMDFAHLPYLDCVTKEVLRIHPLTPAILRTVEEDLKISDKITLPAGCGILISIWGLHHDPNVWGEDHEEFRPERWEDKEAAAKRPIGSYVPFSYGARNCIGKYQGILQFKIMAIHLVRQFKIYADPSVPMRFKLELFIRQRHGVLVSLEKR